MDTGAIILAGGRSSRMGTNKALLKLNETPTIERMIKILNPVFPHPILVTNDPENYRFLGIKTVKDQFPGKGPLAGIHAGLLASPYEVNVITACDMPFISARLAAALTEKCGSYDAVVPVIDGRQQPLFAVYKKKLAVQIEDRLRNNCFRLRDLLEEVNALYLTERELSKLGSLERIFFNMNHPHEYEAAQKWLSARSGRQPE